MTYEDYFYHSYVPYRYSYGRLPVPCIRKLIKNKITYEVPGPGNRTYTRTRNRTSPDEVPRTCTRTTSTRTRSYKFKITKN